MNNKITEEIITQERKKFIEELIQNSIISKDKLKSSFISMNYRWSILHRRIFDYKGNSI